jgi:hypothetical protein
MPGLLCIFDDRRLLVAFAALLLFITLSAQTARAQLCPHSRISLVVRDRRGKIIDPTPLSMRRRLAHRFDGVRIETIVLPRGFKGGARRAKSLMFYSGSCTFGPLEEATFDHRGTRMQLVFRNAKRIHSDYSTFYTIEMPPLGQGTYEIDLGARRGLLSDAADLTSRSTAGPVVFSAAAWRKTSASVPDFARPHAVSFRGVVTHGQTRAPLPGVKVELQLGETAHAFEATSGRDGRFHIEGIADEQITGADRVFVRAVLSGFAPTEVFFDRHRTLALSSNVFDNIEVELRPLVNVKGRMIDEASGRAARVSPGVFAAFAVVNEGFTKGNYRTRIFHPSQAAINPDGTFTMQVAAGKNTFSIADYQNYQPVAPGTRQELLDSQLEFDIKPENPPDIVFRVRRAGR